MILIHSALNGKAAIVDPKNILFAEDIEGEDDEGNKITCTRVHLRIPLREEIPIFHLDIQEDAEMLLKSILSLAKE